MAEQDAFSQIPEVSPKELKEMLEVLDKMDNPPALMVYGPPGVGKTSILNDFAADKKYEPRVKHLSRMDTTDWSGIPKQDDKSEYTEFLPIGLFKQPSKGYSRIVLFFDEINTAQPAVLNAALDVILEKKADEGTYGKGATLPKNTVILAAGNLGEEDGTFIEELSTAVKTRMIQVKLGQDVPQWLEWAESKGVHESVRSFIKDSGLDTLLDINALKESVKQAATPRGWERVSDYIKTIYSGDVKPGDAKKEDTLANLVCGTVGKKQGNLFVRHLERFLGMAEGVTGIEDWNMSKAKVEAMFGMTLKDAKSSNINTAVTIVEYGLENKMPGGEELAKNFITEVLEFLRKQNMLNPAELTALNNAKIVKLKEVIKEAGLKDLLKVISTIN